MRRNLGGAVYYLNIKLAVLYFRARVTPGRHTGAHKISRTFLPSLLPPGTVALQDVYVSRTAAPPLLSENRGDSIFSFVEESLFREWSGRCEIRIYASLRLRKTVETHLSIPEQMPYEPRLPPTYLGCRARSSPDSLSKL